MKDAVWLVLAIVGWGAWPLTQAMASRSMHPMSVTLANLCICTVIGPFLYLWMRASGQQLAFNVPGILWTLGSTLLAGLAGVSYLFATRHTPTNVVLSYTQTYPALSFMLCWLFLGETFTFQRVIGATMIVVGCVVMNR
jgi:drug/metabolite transporter (DMT)-like permease